MKAHSSTYLLNTCHVIGSFRRRSRKFQDSLLDNIDSSSPKSSDSIRQPARPGSPAQPKPGTETSSFATPAKRKKLSQPQESADDTGQQENKAAADDWGWGYTGPTLATIGSNYEKKLQAPTDSNAAQPAEQEAYEDNWGHEEGMQDWEDGELLDDDLPEAEAPDVTLLSGNDVVLP